MKMFNTGLSKLHAFIFALVAACAFTASAVGDPLGFEVANLVAQLGPCVDWLTGATGHVDGIQYAEGGAVSAAAVREALNLLDNQDEPTEEEVGDATRDLATGDGRAGDPPEPVPQDERGDEGADVRAGNRQGRALHRRSINDLNHSQREDLGNMLYRLLQAQAMRRERQESEAVRDLVQAGYYGPEAREALLTGDSRSLSTLTDTDGAVFLPETVMNEIARIVPDFGVARRLGRQIPISSGSQRIPNVTAGLVAFWVGEGQEIKARKAAFGKKNIDPEKMGIIVPWTTELEEETGEAFLNLIMELIAEAFAELEDQSALYGDGTAAYGGITGIANVAGAGEYVLPDRTGTSGGNGQSVQHVTPSDFLKLKYRVPSTVRQRGTYIISSDLMEVLADTKDADGNYILSNPREDERLPRLWGRPVETSDAVIGPESDAADSAFAFYGDFSRLLIGQQRGMTSMLLDQASITDVDDATIIKLAAQDMKAIKMTQRVEFQVALAAAFARLKTAAAAAA